MFEASEEVERNASSPNHDTPTPIYLICICSFPVSDSVYFNSDFHSQPLNTFVNTLHLHNAEDELVSAAFFCLRNSEETLKKSNMAKTDFLSRLGFRM